VYVARALDAAGEPAVQNLHRRLGHLELRRRAMGNIHLWPSTVVRALQSRGLLKIFISAHNGSNVQQYSNKLN